LETPLSGAHELWFFDRVQPAWAEEGEQRAEGMDFKLALPRISIEIAPFQPLLIIEFTFYRVLIN